MINSMDSPINEKIAYDGTAAAGSVGSGDDREWDSREELKAKRK
jgi:hypothetical protein